jgi:hypothetical protein
LMAPGASGGAPLPLSLPSSISLTLSDVPAPPSR